MVASMKVQGRREIGRKMRALPARIKQPVQKAVTEGAEEIARMQRNLAPEHTGKLKKSIRVTPPGQTTPSHSQPGGARTTREFEALVTAGDDEVRYPHLVEYGTAPHPQGGLGEGTQHPGTTAQPFFWPGYRLARKRVRVKVKRAIGKAVKAGFEA
jgi:HK97 gp10 family phage protein